MSSYVTQVSVPALEGSNYVIPAIYAFDLAEFVEQPTELLNRISAAFDECKMDGYDVSKVAEDIVKALDPKAWINGMDAWTTFWNTVHTLDEPWNAIADFWMARGLSEEIVTKIREIRAFRKRACWRYSCRKRNLRKWAVVDLGRPNFKQATGDERERDRLFEPIPENLRTDEAFINLVGIFCALVEHSVSHGKDEFEVTAHLMRTYALDDGRKPAPEGIHQDGADFIVSAIVIERENVHGGVSTVYYDKGKTIALQRELGVGQGIFQADNETGYWHGVSKVTAIDRDRSSFRSILGFDIVGVG